MQVELAWLVPPSTLITTVNAERLDVIGRAGASGFAVQPRELSAGELKSLKRAHRVACDLEPDPNAKTGVYSFTVKQLTIDEPSQAVVLTKPFPGQTIGMKEATASAAQDAAARGVLVPTEPGFAGKVLSRSVSDPAGRFLLSFYAVYGSDGPLERDGEFLFGKDANLLAKDWKTEDPSKPWCADCGFPSVEDGIELVHRPENMILTSALSFPILVADSSTIEGRSTSLRTYSSRAGKVPLKQWYEYVVTCSDDEPLE